jgi:predicted permease
MDTLWQDLRYGLRQLLRQRGLTAAAALSLGLGIGANTTIFSLLNAVFLNPLPAVDAEDVVFVYRTFDQQGQTAGGLLAGGLLPMSYPNYADFRDESDSFESLAAEGFGQFSISSHGEPEQVFGAYVTASYFAALGLRPAAGRFFLPEEDETRGTHPVAVLSHGLWQARFGGRPIAGEAIRLNGRSVTVVGVAPPGFRGLTALTPYQLFVPTAIAPALVNDPGIFGQLLDHRGIRMFNVAGRLREGVSLERAAAELGALSVRLAEAHPEWNRNRGTHLVPLREATLNPAFRGTVESASAVLLGAVGLILAIACANVANLLLARSVARRGEIAMRLALGAQRRRLVRQLLTESALLWLLGGGAGWLLAIWGRRLLWSFRPPFVAEDAVELALDLRVLGFALGLTLLSGLAFGLVPALRAARTDLIASLRSRGAAGETGRGGLRQLLVGAQVALSLVALVAAGLFVQSLRNAQRIDTGYETGNLLLFSFDTSSRGYTTERAERFHEEIVERVVGLPGVAAAALGSNAPLSAAGSLRLQIPGAEEITGPDGIYVTTSSVSPGYLETLGVDVVQGRGFDAGDRARGNLVAIVNETMAKQFWDGAAVGRSIRWAGEEGLRQIVGIAEDVKYATLGEPPTPYVYVPLSQMFNGNLTLHVRTRSTPAGLLPEVERAIRGLDPELAIADARAMDQVLEESLWGARTGALLLGGFALVALLLAATGIYAVVSQMVQQARREMGIRIALGAGRRRVLALVLRRGMAQVLLGTAAGGLLAASTSHLLSSLLYGLSGLEAGVFAGAALLLAAVAVAACLIPGRAAVRVDPMTTLRDA